MFAVTNLRSGVTGIPGVTMFVSQGSVHGPRVKVYAGETLTREALLEPVIIQLTDPPKLLVGQLPGRTQMCVLRFLGKNRELLLRYCGDINMGTDELLAEIQKA